MRVGAGVNRVLTALILPLACVFASCAEGPESPAEVSADTPVLEDAPAPEDEGLGDISGFFRPVTLSGGIEASCREAVSRMKRVATSADERPVNTMSDAQRLLWRSFSTAHAGWVCVEYEGYFMVSRFGDKPDDGSFSSGFAVKKGTTEIYRWE